jgi:hypothetical protein
MLQRAALQQTHFHPLDIDPDCERTVTFEVTRTGA